jgi:glycosyltransferase involved in cell wall biosynthesis
VSPSLAKLLIDRRLASDVRYIPNMLDPIFIQSLPPSEKRTGVFIFFNVAELSEKKGHAILLEAFASAFKGKTNIRLVIGGDGALMNTLRHHAELLGIDGMVEFSGMLDRESLRSKMLEADVFVLPSLFETFGVVVIEAMSCGKPVIATVCGGPEHILDASTGILIEAGNMKALSKAMLDMYANSSTYDADLIRSKALLEYGPAVVATSLETVYRKIMGMKP